MENEKRLIEIPADGVISIPIMFGDTTVGEKRIDLSHYPTVDAVEVKHGEWIYEEEPDENNNIQASCSVCFAGDLHATALMNKVPYCWKCGAKMDGGTGNE